MLYMIGPMWACWAWCRRVEPRQVALEKIESLGWRWMKAVGKVEPRVPGAGQALCGILQRGVCPRIEGRMNGHFVWGRWIEVHSRG